MIIKDTESVDVHTSTGPMRTYLFRPAAEGRYPGLLLFSEIFQVTGPIRRAAAMLARLSGAETIEWLDRHQPGALLTPSQTYGGG
jgi:hypothetical protein